MFNSYFITGIIFYILGLVIERRIDAKAVSYLSPQQFELLRTEFTQLKRVNSIINTILIIGYLTILFTFDLSTYVLIGSYVAIYLTTFTIIAAFYVRGLKQLQFPREFIRNFIGAKLIRVLAFITFVSTLISATSRIE